MRINCHFKLVAAILLLLTGVGSAVGAIPDVEREALIALYNSTNGDNWTNKYNWLGPPGTEGTWYGVTLTGRGHVWKLYLDNNNLEGQIPPELGNLKDLMELELSANKLSGPIPPQLGNLDRTYWLSLHHNQLSGSIPPELGNIRVLMRLDLRANQLSGLIPPELGSRDLYLLALSANKLSGPIPPELGNLKELQSESVHIGYNALYTNDTSLRDFLNSKTEGGDWEGTQTIAPTDVTADSLSGDSIKVSWTPIRFTEFSGGYQVFYSTSSGGPYTLFGTTADKKASFLTVTGLNPGTTYYFVVQTVTNPHDLNKNTVVSEFSEEASGSQRP